MEYFVDVPKWIYIMIHILVGLRFDAFDKIKEKKKQIK